MYKTLKNIQIIGLLIHLCLASCDQYQQIRLNKINKTINAQTLFNAGDFRGKGSFGQVNVVTFSGISLAIKKIRLNGSSSYSEFQRNYDSALHEIKILKDLSTSQDGDKYFPYFYGCGFEGNLDYGPLVIYVIQEILYKDLEKQNAVDLINNVIPKDRIKLYLELAKGLLHMHKMNYVHADLKPANMMTNQSVRNGINGLHFKLIDFGMTDTTDNYILGGSPCYNSPEKVNGQHYNKFSHDVWAYGLTVAAIEGTSYYLFRGFNNDCFINRFTDACGRALFKNVSNIMEKIFNAEFSNIIKNCVDFNEVRRYKTMDPVVKAIEKILEDNNKEMNIESMTTTINRRDIFKVADEKEIKRIKEIRRGKYLVRDDQGKVANYVNRDQFKGYKAQEDIPIQKQEYNPKPAFIKGGGNFNMRAFEDDLAKRDLVDYTPPKQIKAREAPLFLDNNNNNRLEYNLPVQEPPKKKGKYGNYVVKNTII